MNGGGIVSDDLTTATVNSPEAVEAVTFYTDFYKNGQSPASTLENDGLANRRLFIANQVATYQSGQFDVPAIRTENANINIGVFPIPHPEGKETAAILGGWSFIVPKDAKNPEEAKLFLQFINSSENQAFFTDTFPARISSMSCRAVQRSDPRIVQGHAAARPPGADPQGVGPDHAGLFRRHPAHPSRRPDGAGVDGPGQRRDPGSPG